MRNSPLLRGGLIQGHYCTHDPTVRVKDELATDTCGGDAGAPLQFTPDHSKIAKIVAMASFGVGCGNKDIPSVNTRVAYYLDWIESIVWPDLR